EWWVTGRRPVAEAIRAGMAIEVLIGSWVRSTPALRDVLVSAEEAGVVVREVPRPSLDGIADDHHGVAARIRRPSERGDGFVDEHPFGDEDVVVVLDGITDPNNLGAAARAAEAAGVALLVSRVRRAAGLSPAALRASAGALAHLPLARVTNLRRTLDRLKDRGFTVVGLDGAATTSFLDSPSPAGRVALVVGSEGEGLSRLVREGCDLLVSIPMRGRVESLNASAALAAVLYGYVLPSRSSKE